MVARYLQNSPTCQAGEFLQISWNHEILAPFLKRMNFRYLVFNICDDRLKLLQYRRLVDGVVSNNL